MIKNNKGQALIEFVLILPIVVLLLFSIINIGMIFVKKSELENKVTDIIYIWRNKGTSVKELEELFEKNNLKTEIIKNNTTSFITIKVSDKVSLTAPINNEYKLEIKRVIPFE